MVEKIKLYAGYILGLATLVLSALLFRQSRKTEGAEAELAKAVTKNLTQENDHDREIAKTEADSLVDSYERLKREYDGSGSGEGKL